MPCSYQRHRERLFQVSLDLLWNYTFLHLPFPEQGNPVNDPRVELGGLRKQALTLTMPKPLEGYVIQVTIPWGALPQPQALSSVVKQAYGVEASAADTTSLDNFGEGTVTGASRVP